MKSSDWLLFEMLEKLRDAGGDSEVWNLTQTTEMNRRSLKGTISLWWIMSKTYSVMCLFIFEYFHVCMDLTDQIITITVYVSYVSVYTVHSIRMCMVVYLILKLLI